jgi:hypothetical protein
MNNNYDVLSCVQIKKQDLVCYLASLGYQPTKIRGANFWYVSPLRNETIASFKVNRTLNCWYDFGLGQGGNLIDFGVRYFKCSVKEFIQKISNPSSFHQPPIDGQPVTTHKEGSIQIIHERPLTSLVLQRYLKERRIPLFIAQKFCKEVIFQIQAKRYRAIGFPNKSSGYELRTSWFKGSSAPKDVTLIENGCKELSVFEGFFDFLSFAAIGQKLSLPRANYLVLNSVSFFEKSRPVMERHQHIHLYLDQDKTGQNCTQYALSLSSRYVDQSSLYKGYKDLNDWIMHIGKGQGTCIHISFHEPK